MSRIHLYLGLIRRAISAADSCPLFDYAIRYWYYHVQRSGIQDKELARLIEEVLQTNWKIYCLVTYPNISTRYKPWAGTRVSMPVPGNGTEKDNQLCTACQKISTGELRRKRGMKHRDVRHPRDLGPRVQALRNDPVCSASVWDRSTLPDILGDYTTS